MSTFRQPTGILAGHFADGRGHDTDMTCCPYPPVATADELAEDSDASTDWRFGSAEPERDTYVELPGGPLTYEEAERAYRRGLHL